MRLVADEDASDRLDGSRLLIVAKLWLADFVTNGAAATDDGSNDSNTKAERMKLKSVL